MHILSINPYPKDHGYRILRSNTRWELVQHLIQLRRSIWCLFMLSRTFGVVRIFGLRLYGREIAWFWINLRWRCCRVLLARLRNRRSSNVRRRAILLGLRHALGSSLDGFGTGCVMLEYRGQARLKVSDTAYFYITDINSYLYLYGSHHTIKLDQSIDH